MLLAGITRSFLKALGELFALAMQGPRVSCDAQSCTEQRATYDALAEHACCKEHDPEDPLTGRQRHADEANTRQLNAYLA